ncbi:MAG TPA: glycine zipper 2TM domain-containing protein [Steroidobacteraceae bacterium]
MISSKTLSLFPIALAAFAIAACGNKQPPAETAATDDPAVQEQIDEDAEMKAKEEELARREAGLALKEKEAELARREADLAKATAKPRAAAPKPATTTAAAPKPAPAGPRNYTVPAGTSLTAQLPAAISTKTARVGDRVSAYLTNDLVVDGKVIAKSGALLQGSVTEVVSGSKKIGGTPTLGLTFDNLTLADGGDMPVRGSITQVAAKSDTGKDTAKIAGGAIAGAVIGHQIDSDKGKIIGGLIGAAAGTVAAKKTGSEVELPAGTQIGFTLEQPLNVTM